MKNYLVAYNRYNNKTGENKIKSETVSIDYELDSPKLFLADKYNRRSDADYTYYVLNIVLLD